VSGGEPGRHRESDGGPCAPFQGAEDQRLAQELRRNVPAGRAEGPTEPDLGATLQDPNSP